MTFIEGKTKEVTKLNKKFTQKYSEILFSLRHND